MAVITATSTNPWATAFPSVPTAADDVVIPATFTVTIPTATTVVCRSLTTTGTGSLTFASTTAVISIGDGTAGLANVALSIATTSTITLTGIGTINFISTSATQQTVTSGGKTLPNLTFGASSASSYQLQDNLTFTGAIMTHTFGTLDWNGKTLSGASYTSNTSNIRTLTTGAATVTFTAASTAWTLQSANMTITANTAVVTCTGTFPSMTMGSANYNGMSFTLNGLTSTTTWSGNPTGFGTLTLSGTANVLDGWASAGNISCATLVVSGNSVNLNRFLVSSTVMGTNITITVSTSFTFTNVDFMDITAAGAAGTWTGTSMGDAQGNSNITFTSAFDHYKVGGAGNFSSTTMWSTTSGGSSGSAVPLPQDKVIMDANSGSSALTVDLVRAGKDWVLTGYTGSVSMVASYLSYGNLTLGSGMGNFGSGSGIRTLTLAGRGSQTITSNGKAFGLSTNITFDSFGGSYQLQDNLTISNNGIQTVGLNHGTLDLNAKTITCDIFTSTNSFTRSILMNGAAINLATAGGNTIWNIGVSTGMTFTGLTGTINMTFAAGTSRIFAGGGLAYGTVNYTVANSPGILNFSGANYFDTLNIGSQRAVTWPTGTISTVKSFTGTGVNNGYQYFGGQVQTGAGVIAVSTANTAALQLTGDITLDAEVALPSYTALTVTSLIAKAGATAGYALRVGTTGIPQVFIGTASGTASASLSTVLTAGQHAWIRVTWQDSTDLAKFYYSTNGSTYTQLGTNVSVVQTGIPTDTSILYIGSRTTGNDSMTGTMYRARIWSDITQSTLVYDANFTTKAFGANSFTESSSNALTVTIDGAVNQAGDGRVLIASATGATAAYLEFVGPVNTVDYQTVQDILSTTPYKYYAGVNSLSVSGNTNVILTAPVAQPYITKQINGAQTSIASVTVTFPFAQTATAGNILVAAFTATLAPGTVTGPSGFTLITNNNATAGAYLYTWYKVSTGGETSVTVGASSAPVDSLSLYEIAAPTGTLSLDVNDVNNSAASTVTTISTGSGVTNTTTTAYAMAFWSSGSGASGFGNGVSITNSYQESRVVTVNPVLRGFALPLLSSASRSTTYTWTNSRLAASQLVVFKDVTAGTTATSSTLMLMGV